MPQAMCFDQVISSRPTVMVLGESLLRTKSHTLKMTTLRVLGGVAVFVPVLLETWCEALSSGISFIVARGVKSVASVIHTLPTFGIFGNIKCSINKCELVPSIIIQN